MITSNFKGHHHTEESRLKISLHRKGQRSSIRTEFKSGQNPWNTGLTRATDTRIDNIARMKLGHFRSEKTKEKCSLSNKGHHYSPKTEFKQNINHPYWGKHFSEEHRRNIGEGNRGKLTSNEVRAKIRNAILNLPNFKGNKGSTKHQDAVKDVASWFQNDGHKIDIEKTLHVNGHHRIIDILLNNNLCIEVGSCDSTKMNELASNNFVTIQVPYEFLGV